MAVGGQPAHIEETGAETARFAIGVESGQVVFSVQHTHSGPGCLDTPVKNPRLLVQLGLQS